MAVEVVKIAGLRLAIEGGDKFTQDLEKARHQMRLGAQEMGLLREQQKITGPTTETLSERVRVLSDRYKAQEKELKTIAELQEKAVELHDEDSEEVRKLSERYVQAEKDLTKLSTQLAYANLDLEKHSSKLIQAGKSAQEIGEKWTKAGDKMSKVGSSLSRNVTAPIVAGAGFAVKSAMDFESALAGVAKTTDMTGDELQEFGVKIREMSKEIPSAATDIAAVAEAAGQLGIEKENILDFTRVIIDLSNSTNIVGEEGAQQIAKFANIMGVHQSSFDQFGSAIVELGNNTATTEKDILNMAMRLAGAGKQANMHEADVLGLAAALSSLGLESEAGGTAFSKMITKLQLAVELGGDDLGEFAKVAGMSAKEFKEAWEEDAITAVNSFVVGLGDMERNGKSTSAIIQELGIKEIRLADALRRTAGAGDLLSDAVLLSNSAWSENIALTKEASQRYETSESKMKIQMNRLKDVGIEIGTKLLPHVVSLAENIGDLISKFNKLSPGMQEIILKTLGISAALGPVVKVGGGIAKGIGGLTTGFGKLIEKLGNRKAIAEAAASMADMGGKAAEATGAITGVGNAAGGVAKSMMSPLGWIAVIGLAAAGVYKLVQKINEVDPAVAEARKRAEELKNEHDALNAEIDTTAGVAKAYAEELKTLMKVEEKSAEEKEKIKFLVDELNKVVPDLKLNYDHYSDSLNKTTREIDYQIQSLEKQMRIEAGKKMLAQYYEEEVRLKLAIAKSTKEAAEEENRYREILAKSEPGTYAQAQAFNNLQGVIRKNKNALGELNDKYEDVKKTIKSVTGEIVSGSINVGRASVDGIKRGMDEAAKGLYTTATGIATNVLNTMKRTFQIRSPSRETWWLGEMMIEGFVKGLEENVRELERVSQTVPERSLAAMEKVRRTQLERAVSQLASAEVVQRMHVQVQSDRPITRNINVDQLVVREEADIERIASRLHELDQRDMRGMGVPA